MSSYTSGSVSIAGDLAGASIIGSAAVAAGALIIGGTAFGGYKLVEGAVKGISAISESLVSRNQTKRTNATEKFQSVSNNSGSS